MKFLQVVLYLNYITKLIYQKVVNIVDTQSLINHNIAEHLIKTSEEESIEISKMLIPTTDNENKLKHFTENELIEELKRREKERITTK